MISDSSAVRSAAVCGKHEHTHTYTHTHIQAVAFVVSSECEGTTREPIKVLWTGVLCSRYVSLLSGSKSKRHVARSPWRIANVPVARGQSSETCAARCGVRLNTQGKSGVWLARRRDRLRLHVVHQILCINAQGLCGAHHTLALLS